MGILIFPVVAALVLAVLSWRRERDTRYAGQAYARTVFYTALALLAIYALFWFVFGFGEIFAGDIGGLIHIVPAVTVVFLWVLAYRRPLEAGLVLTGLGLVQGLYIFFATGGSASSRLNGVLLAALPFLAIGLLFLAADRLARE
jgi:energy-converting hydrogenase Eha subunit A